MARVFELDDHRPVWMTCKEVCRSCGHAELARVHIDADLDRLECAGCHEMTSAVTHLDIAPDSPDYVWVPRMELARSVE